MAIARGVAHLQQADEIAGATRQNMADQTAQLERMHGKMDGANSRLDETEATINSMEKFTFMTGMKDWGKDIMGFGKKQEPRTTVVNGSIPSLREGELLKRGPSFGFKWEPRWCVLFPNRLVWYKDSKKWEKKGEMLLTAKTKATHFQKSSAPGEAVKHRGEKPFGFVVDSDPSAGKARHLLYFDAGGNAELTGWIRSIADAAKALQPVSMPMGNEPREKNDKGELNRLLGNLEDKAIDMQTEASGQAELVVSLTTKVDHVTGRIEEQRKRVRKL